MENKELTLSEFKSKIKNAFAILGALVVIKMILGIFITIAIAIGLVYIYMQQKMIWLKIKNQYNAVIEIIYKSVGKNINVEKYRK